jgi:hypothetical protein
MRQALEKEKARILADNRLQTIVDVNMIATIMKELPLNKSAGPAKVRPELLKYAGKSRAVYVEGKILECILNNKVMPRNMNNGQIIPIIKDQKGSTSAISNVRGITFSEVYLGNF